MKIKHIFLTGLIFGITGVAAQNPAFDITDIMSACSNSLYCQAERSGGGQNGCDYTPIIEKYLEKFKVALEKEKAFVNHQDTNGRTPLMRAAAYQLSEFMELLIDAGADITMTDHDGKTALSYVTLGVGILAALRYNFHVLTKLIMHDFYTKERHNTCVNLLTRNGIKRWWYKRSEEKPRIIKDSVVFIL